jgi:hypothetical protein
MVLGKYQSQVAGLPPLADVRYENIFRMYPTNVNQYYYNLLQSLYIDGNIDPKKVYYMTVKESLPWSIISYNAYGITELWWLIVLVNNIDNPVKQPDNGTVLKLIRPEYISSVITEIKKSLR